MVDQLSRLHQRTTEPGTKSGTVKAGFKQTQQVITGHTAHLLGFTKGSAELFLKQTVGVPQLLLFNQLLTVVRHLAPNFIRAVLAGTMTAPFEESVILGVAVYVDAKTADDLSFGAGKLCHIINFPCGF
jgi:hypothetical protein